MEMKKVLILMATYNGTNYIREQLDSLLNQSYSNIEILIRDDASKDNTIEILREYAERDSRVTFYQGENLGSASCFFDLMKHAPASDYYAFCDQDDVWETDKIKAAVTLLEENAYDGPLLYTSNLKIVDQNLTYMVDRFTNGFKTDNKYYCLTEYRAVGCTMVFNSQALELVKTHVPTDYMMHDAWMFMTCMIFGRVIYDDNAYILYRQHSNNVIGYKSNPFVRAKNHFKRLFDRSLQPRLAYAKDFLLVYGDLLQEEDRQKLERIVNYKKSFGGRMKLLFDRKICASSWGRDFRYRFLIVWGII